MAVPWPPNAASWIGAKAEYPAGLATTGNWIRYAAIWYPTRIALARGTRGEVTLAGVGAPVMPAAAARRPLASAVRNTIRNYCPRLITAGMW